MAKLLRLTLMVLLVSACGCRKQPTTAPLPPAVVTVSQPISRMVTESIEYSGTTSAAKTVQLRSQVRGYLESTLFKPRERVTAGQVLFQIDPRPFQAEVDKAQAELEVAQAQLALSEAKLSRMEEAWKAKSISEVQVIEQRADRDKAKADIDRCKAALETTQLNLAYTKITAPIDGLMGLDYPKKGDLIDPQSTLLSTITDDSTVYVYFNVSEYDTLRVRQAYRPSSQPSDGALPPVPVFIGLSNEAGFPHEGVLDYISPQLDRQTGTVEVRARFDNKDRALVGGLFVRVRVPISEPREALLVAERALGQDQGQRYVLIVNDKNVVEYRPLKVGVMEGPFRVIEAGLKADDWVIVNGLQRVRPGVTVAPQRVSMESFVAASTQPARQSSPGAQSRAGSHPSMPASAPLSQSAQ